MKLGAHESTAGGLYKAIERALEDGCQSLQLFVKPPNRWEGIKLSDKNVSTFIEFSKKLPSNSITTHAAYLINLASPKDDVRKKSVEALREELLCSDSLKIPYYVLHPGSPLDSGFDNGMTRIIEGIDIVYSNDINAMLLLEITSGMGNSIGGKFEHLEQIIDGTRYKDKLGICLDTCHMYSAGYDITNKYDAVMGEIKRRFGDKLKVFHLNDSKHPLSSRKDRHEFIGKGFIGLETFKRLVNDSYLRDVLGILETPVEDNHTYIDELNTLKGLVEEWTQ
jgi:deoxyribonuclease-4